MNKKNKWIPAFIFGVVSQMAVTSGWSQGNLGIDTVTVDVNSGKSVGASTEQDSLNNIFKLEQRLVKQILQQLGVQVDQLPPEIRQALAKKATTNLDALVRFGEGLMALDNNRFSEAEQAFRQATDLGGGHFEMAQSMADAMPEIDLGGLDINQASASQVTGLIASTSTATAQTASQTTLSQGASALVLTRALAQQASQPKVQQANPGKSPTANKSDHHQQTSAAKDDQQENSQADQQDAQVAASTTTTTTLVQPDDAVLGPKSTQAFPGQDCDQGVCAFVAAGLMMNGAPVAGYGTIKALKTQFSNEQGDLIGIAQRTPDGSTVADGSLVIGDTSGWKNLDSPGVYVAGFTEGNSGDYNDDLDIPMTHNAYVSDTLGDSYYPEQMRFGFWTVANSWSDSGGMNSYAMPYVAGGWGRVTNSVELDDLRSNNAELDYAGKAGMSWVDASGGNAGVCNDCGTFNATLDYGENQLDWFNVDLNNKTSGMNVYIAGRDIPLGSRGGFQFNQDTQNTTFQAGASGLSPAYSGNVAGRPFGSTAQAVGGTFGLQSQSGGMGSPYLINGYFAGGVSSSGYAGTSGTSLGP